MNIFLIPVKICFAVDGKAMGLSATSSYVSKPLEEHDVNQASGRASASARGCSQADCAPSALAYE